MSESIARWILFKGEEMVFIGRSFAQGGAVAYAQEYEEFECSHAHLFPDGIVRRFGRPIGTIDDIQDLRPYDDD